MVVVAVTVAVAIALAVVVVGVDRVVALSRSFWQDAVRLNPLHLCVLQDVRQHPGIVGELSIGPLVPTQSLLSLSDDLVHYASKA